MRGETSVVAEEIKEAGSGISDFFDDLADLKLFGVVRFDEVDGIVHQAWHEFLVGFLLQSRTPEEDVFTEKPEMTEIKCGSFVGRRGDDGGHFLEIGLDGTIYDKRTICGFGQQVKHVGDVRICKGGVPAGLWSRSHVQDDAKPRLNQSAAKGMVRVGGHEHSEAGLERDGVPFVNGVNK